MNCLRGTRVQRALYERAIDNTILPPGQEIA
jgi:hypothetical protein